MKADPKILASREGAGDFWGLEERAKVEYCGRGESKIQAVDRWIGERETIQTRRCLSLLMS